MTLAGLAALVALGPAFAQGYGSSSYGTPSLGPKPYGILLLGHGGGPDWNRSVEDVRKAVANKKIPVETALGMADPAAIQSAVDRLAAQRVAKIVAVPLFISSHSEVIDQTMYVLGMRKTPSEDFMKAPHAHMAQAAVKRVQVKLPLVMTQALDDHPLVAAILYDRAKEMSRDPSKEYVLLVGHGPLLDSENELWLRYMNKLGAKIQERGKFKGVFAATLRDDSPADVREKADKILRDLVRRLSRKGKVLVIPHLISSGGIEKHVQSSLEGMFFTWTGKTLLPDRRLAQWVVESAQKASALPNMRQFNDAGRPLPPPDQKHIIPMEPASSSRRSNGY